MKDNNDMLHGGHLRPEYARAWRRYFAKFVESYRKEGVPVWGITIQNEPMGDPDVGIVRVSGVGRAGLSQEPPRPVMAQEGLLGKVHIIVWDHNRDLHHPAGAAIFEDRRPRNTPGGSASTGMKTGRVGNRCTAQRALLVNRLYPTNHPLYRAHRQVHSTGYGRYWEACGRAYASVHKINSH